MPKNIRNRKQETNPVVKQQDDTLDVLATKQQRQESFNNSLNVLPGGGFGGMYTSTSTSSNWRGDTLMHFSDGEIVKVKQDGSFEEPDCCDTLVSKCSIM